LTKTIIAQFALEEFLLNSQNKIKRSQLISTKTYVIRIQNSSVNSKSDEYSTHRGPQYQSRVRVCSTQVGLKSKLYIAECEGGNDFSGFVLDLFQKVYCKI
jgi:hypothetical protein